MKKEPKVHLYTICWNEAKFLEFFFQYYDPIVEEYHFYDDGSNDGTLDILAAHPNVQVHELEIIQDSFVLSSQVLHNSFWKKSIGKADWVIITAVDEFLYHAQLKRYLNTCSESGVTAIPATGFQMISDYLPVSGIPLITQIKSGSYFSKMNKLSIFNPNKITTTNYAVGRHSANPEGQVVFPENDVLLNLHYKYLSFEGTLARHHELNNKLRGLDKKNKWGHRYAWERKRLKQDWDAYQNDAIVNVFSQSELFNYLEGKIIDKWWR